MQTITTKYHGPTETKPARCSATTTSGMRVYVTRDKTHTDDQNHARALQAMGRKIDWQGWLIGGHHGFSEMVWVFDDDMSPRVELSD